MQDIAIFHALLQGMIEEYCSEVQRRRSQYNINVAIILIVLLT